MLTKKQKTLSVIYTFLIGLFFVTIVLSFFFANKHYNEIYHLKEVHNAVIDFEGRAINSFPIITCLKGDWELYYNKWIVTDGIDCAPDLIMDIQERWTGKIVDGKKLPSTGYASYRLIVKNLNPDDSIMFWQEKAPCAFRVFFNRELVFASGTMSKNPDEVVGSYSKTIKEPYSLKEHNTTTVEIIMEIAQKDIGGVNRVPFLDDGKCSIPMSVGNLGYNDVLPFFPIIALITLMLINLFLQSKGKDLPKPYAGVALIAALLLRTCTSVDAFSYLAAFSTGIFYRSPIFDFTNILIYVYVTTLLVVFALVNYLRYRKVIDLKLWEFGCFVGVNVLILALYYLLPNVAARYLFIGAHCLTLIYIYYLLFNNFQKRKLNSAVYIMLTTIIFLVLLIEVVERTLFIAFSVFPTFSYGMVIVSILVAVAHARESRDNNKKALQAAKLAKEVADIQNKLLKGQINPHFIFNSLTTIQNQYHNNVEYGDKALQTFSQHLRANIDSCNKDFIPFDEELKNIQNYIDLINLRQEKPALLLFDINYKDFSIPPIVLQPLVDNAVHYSKIQDKDNGFIQVTSALVGEDVIIEVVDNGVGFDQTKISENSTGIANVRERLQYALNASLTISSIIGQGTTITIRFKNNNKELPQK